MRAVRSPSARRCARRAAARRDERPRVPSEIGMLVDRAWRGRSVGSALMVTAIAWAREEGLHKLCLKRLRAQRGSACPLSQARLRRGGAARQAVPAPERRAVGRDRHVDSWLLISTALQAERWIRAQVDPAGRDRDGARATVVDGPTRAARRRDRLVQGLRAGASIRAAADRRAFRPLAGPGPRGARPRRRARLASPRRRGHADARPRQSSARRGCGHCRCYAELQRGEAPHADDHLAHGVPDLRVATWPARYDDLVNCDLPTRQP